MARNGIVLKTAGTASLPRAVVRAIGALPVVSTPPPAVAWPWWPANPAYYGLSSRRPGIPRIWFVGEPEGLQAQALAWLASALRRGDGGLTPLTRDTLARLENPVDVAILTAPS
jgi:hypothetical protein